MANTVPVMIWMPGTDKLCTYFNMPWLDFAGRSIESELGNGWVELGHPQQSQSFEDHANTEIFAPSWTGTRGDCVL
jgi:hypothetical protein